ncbi:MAG: hypothetical protein WKF78_03550 [Candidatus Limnocylindrales bacterium]
MRPGSSRGSTARRWIVRRSPFARQATPACASCAGSGSWIRDRSTAYRASGGYAALSRAIELGPEGVIAEVTAARLMGRGGAAFPTGRKWAAVAIQPAQPHYLVCNADEIGARHVQGPRAPGR